MVKSVCENQKLPSLNASVRYTAKSRHDMPMKKIATCVIASNNLQVSADSHSPPNSAKNSSLQNQHTPQFSTAKPTLKREFEEPVPEFSDVNYSSRDENGGNARVDRFREARELPTWGHSREDTFDKNQRNPRVKIERIVDDRDDHNFLPFSNGEDFSHPSVKIEPGSVPTTRVKLQRIDDGMFSGFF